MKVEDFYRYIAPELPGAPSELMRQAVMFTANSFCVDTQVLDMISDPIDLYPGQADYDMDPMSGAVPVTIKSVWTANRELRPVTMSELFRLLPNWQSASNSEPSFYNMVKGFGILTVYPTPAEPISAKLTVHAVYAPQQTGQILPDLLFERYFDAIAAGSKARLMIQPGQTWSNPRQAVIYNQVYDAAVNEARGDILHNRVPGSIRVRPIRFGG